MRSSKPPPEPPKTVRSSAGVRPRAALSPRGRTSPTPRPDDTGAPAVLPVLVPETGAHGVDEGVEPLGVAQDRAPRGHLEDSRCLEARIDAQEGVRCQGRLGRLADGALGSLAGMDRGEPFRPVLPPLRARPRAGCPFREARRAERGAGPARGRGARRSPGGRGPPPRRGTRTERRTDGPCAGRRPRHLPRSTYVLSRWSSHLWKTPSGILLARSVGIPAIFSIGFQTRR